MEFCKYLPIPLISSVKSYLPTAEKDVLTLWVRIMADDIGYRYAVKRPKKIGHPIKDANGLF